MAQQSSFIRVFQCIKVVSMCTRSMFLALTICLAFNGPVRAGLIINFDPGDLSVLATGGVVVQSVDLYISHDGLGSNQFSAYDIQVTPGNNAVTLLSAPITNSDFTFDFVHGVSGSAPGPYLITGGSLAANVSVISGGQNLLATIQMNIDTSLVSSGTIDLGAVLTRAERGGFFGVNILGEVSLLPAQLTIASVPEPSSVALLAITMSCLAGRRLRRRFLGSLAAPT